MNIRPIIRWYCPKASTTGKTRPERSMVWRSDAGLGWNRLAASLLSSVLAISLLCVLGSAQAASGEPGKLRGALTGERFRVVVSSDIGGSDNDDYQSMAHFLIYADLFDVEGLISSPPKQGRAKHIREVIDAYEKDYAHLIQSSSNYPKPEQLRDLTKQGAVDPAPAQGFSVSTEGSSWLVERARAKDERPLYVLVWGSITDVAQAVHDAPSIKSKIRVHSIGSWNTGCDPASRDYLFRDHPDLWWIEANTTFRGMYVGGQQAGEFGNKAFLDEHVRGHGALGDFLVAKLDTIRMGDSPTVLYLLWGDPDDPAARHWGGSFVKTGHGPHYWTDSTDPGLTEGKFPGAKSVNVWREEFLKDWRHRMDRTAGNP